MIKISILETPPVTIKTIENEVVQMEIEKNNVLIEKENSSNGSDWIVGHGLKLVENNQKKILSVDMAGKIEKDNTLPISSEKVYTEIGNIEALLKTI